MERESSSPLFLLEVQLISVGSCAREIASCRYALGHKHTFVTITPIIIWSSIYIDRDLFFLAHFRFVLNADVFIKAVANEVLVNKQNMVYSPNC